MIAEVQAEFKTFGATVQKLELLGRTDGGIPANPVAGFLQIGQKKRAGSSLSAHMACLFVSPAPFPGRFHCGFVQRPAFLQGAFALSADGRNGLRYEACSRRGVRLIRRQTPRLCAAKRSPAGAVTPSSDGCRGFALRSVLPQRSSPYPRTDAAALRCAPPARETFPRALFSSPRRRGRCCSQNRAIAARPRPWRCGP